MSSSGFGNFQSSQECLLKCSRPREQREQNGALRPACACGKQSAVTQTGWLPQAKEMDAVFWNLYHPKGKCLLNHRDGGEGGSRDLMSLQRRCPEGGATSRHWTSSCHRCQACSLGGISGAGREVWRGSPNLDPHHGAHARARVCTHACILRSVKISPGLFPFLVLATTLPTRTVHPSSCPTPPLPTSLQCTVGPNVWE